MCAGEGRGVVSGQLWGPTGLGSEGILGLQFWVVTAWHLQVQPRGQGGSPHRWAPVLSRLVSGRLEEGQATCRRPLGTCARLPLAPVPGSLTAPQPLVLSRSSDSPNSLPPQGWFTA